MVEVKNLVKRYGSIKAVNGISFTVEDGEIVADTKTSENVYEYINDHNQDYVLVLYQGSDVISSDTRRFNFDLSEKQGE